MSDHEQLAGSVSAYEKWRAALSPQARDWRRVHDPRQQQDVPSGERMRKCGQVHGGPCPEDYR